MFSKYNLEMWLKKQCTSSARSNECACPILSQYLCCWILTRCETVRPPVSHGRLAYFPCVHIKVEDRGYNLIERTSLYVMSVCTKVSVKNAVISAFYFTLWLSVWDLAGGINKTNLGPCEGYTYNNKCVSKWNMLDLICVVFLSIHMMSHIM